MSAHLMTEKEFSQQIADLAVAMGWKHYHPWTSIHSVAGWPDFVLCRPPRLIFAEVKTDNGKLTAAQREWLETLGQAPHVETFCWRPSDFEEIVALLR